MKKSMREKIQERFKQIQIDRKYEEKSLRFDERRDFVNDTTTEKKSTLEN